MRESETAPYLSLRTVDRAWQDCRRRKRATVRACLYEQRLLDNLVDTRQALADGAWQPGPPVVFTVGRPKMREIYAAQFDDRVVHHWLVPQLEAVLDAGFIFDSASNRRGKGTHFAVNRVQAFMRRQQNAGWYLQLDIASFFNHIHQPTLLTLLANGLRRAIRRGQLTRSHARLLYRVSRRVICQPHARQAIRIGDPSEFARIPPHKRLSGTPDDTGLPIGNLTSQFFANLYMDRLDQFVKHDLRCAHYLRYCDDFVLLHPERAQLEQWRNQIEDFLKQKLRLSLKDEQRVAPIASGVDFLGYIIRPHYRLVRRRVVGHLYEKLRAFKPELIRQQEPAPICRSASPDRVRGRLYARPFRMPRAVGN